MRTVHWKRTLPDAGAMVLAAALCSTGTAVGQASPTAQPAATARPVPQPGAIAAHPDWPKANPDDVRTPHNIIAALSASISGPAGSPRDWNRFRSLFVPDAGRMVITRVPKDGPTDVSVLGIEDYIRRSSGSATPQGFYEIPIAYDIESFGRMTHVYESYGLHRTRDDKPYVRGVNSFELLSDGTRYYVLQVYWDTERADNPLPAKLDIAK